MDEKQYHAEDQINLGALKQLLFGILREFFTFVTFTRLVLRRKLLYLIAGAVIGVGCALGIYFKRPNVFQATMVVTHNKLTKNTYGEIIEQLNRLVATGVPDKLAAELNVPVELVSNVLQIDAQNMSNLPLARDTSTKMYQTFKINIRFLDSATFLDQRIADTLTTAFINYLNNLPYLKKLAEVDRQNALERLAYIEQDMARLDSLKTSINKSIQQFRMPATIYNNAINPAEIYQQSSNLIGLRERTLRQLEVDLDTVWLLDGFKITEVPRSRSLPDLLWILGALGLFTGFLVGLLLETKNRLMPE